MEHLSNTTLGILIVLAILISGFFSSTETGVMSLNRYRLRHLARLKHRSARRVLNLLKRPDRFLGLVLIGNTFAEIVASALATIFALRVLGPNWVGFSTVILTIVVLIFGEIVPKTMAALHPIKVAFLFSWPIQILLTLFYPIVRAVITTSNAILWMFGMRISQQAHETLSSEELRSVVFEAGALIPTSHKNMLLSILDLEKVNVEDVMLPKNEIVGIDLAQPLSQILQTTANTAHTYLPVYEENLENVKGILSVQDIMKLSLAHDLTKELLKTFLKPPYFIPEGTTLNTQLINFRREKQRSGLVVDEYGDIQGLVSMEDILDEIVGDFTSYYLPHDVSIQQTKDGSYLIDGGISVRTLNKKLNWNLPLKGPKTLSGLLMEQLELIPPEKFCLHIGPYYFEIVQVRENMIKKVIAKEIL